MRNWEFNRETSKSWRDRLLPPAWIAVPAPTSSTDVPADAGEGVFCTDRSGVARRRMLDAIGEARGIICVSSFLFADAALRRGLLEAARKGVRCYLLTMSQEHLLREAAADDQNEPEKITQHKQMLDELAGRILVREAKHLHAKFLVIDPSDPRFRRGFVSTANFTEAALTENPELVIEIPSAAVNDLFEQFRVGFWSEAEHELLEAGRLEGLKRIDPLGSRSARTSPIVGTSKTDSTLKQAVMRTIQSARDELWVSTYSIELGEITDAIVAKSRAGVKVRVLMRPMDQNMAAAVALVDAGVDVRGHPRVHAKAILAQVGGTIEGLVMTANLKGQGLDTGFETGILLHQAQAAALASILRSWLESFPMQLRLGMMRGELEGACQLWDRGQLRVAFVGGRERRDLGEIPIEDLRDWESVTPTEWPDAVHDNPMRLPGEITYAWTIKPPRLPRGAVPSKTPDEFPVFEAKGETFLTIESPDDLAQAIPIAEKRQARIVLR